MKQSAKQERAFIHNCPVRQHTADGVNVGRCWHHLSGENGCVCPIHGEISVSVQHYIETGELTDDSSLPRIKQEEALGK